MKQGLILRKARPHDASLIMGFIRELARYEKLSADVTGSQRQLSNALFGRKRFAEVLLAFWNEAPAGFAVYFYQFSTFKTAPVLYLEDLFVKPAFRSRGIGRALFDRLKILAQERGCCRMQWAALDWNEPALRFYKGIGAEQQVEWVRFELPLPVRIKKNAPGKSSGARRKM